MSASKHPVEYDPRCLFPFGLSPIPEVPSELASEVSSVYSYYDEDDKSDEEDTEVKSNPSIMYSGSCSSIKSNHTLDGYAENDDDNTDTDGNDEDDDEEEEEDENTTEVDEENSVERITDFSSDGEHYQSSVTTVMHQTVYPINGSAEFVSLETAVPNLLDEKNLGANCLDNNTNCDEVNHNSHMVDMEDKIEVSPGAVTASKIFRHLQSTTKDKEAIRLELAKILGVLHTTLKSTDSSSNSSASGSSDSESQKSEVEDELPKESFKKPSTLSSNKSSETNSYGGDHVTNETLSNGVLSGKPPIYPSVKTNRTLAPEIEERIRELSTAKPGRSGKEEMQILSKILVTLLCSCRSQAASQELKKIIRHFKDAAREASDEFIGEDCDLLPQSLNERHKRKKSRRRRRRRWSSGANSSHSSHGSEADSQTYTLTPSNTDSKSSGTDDEKEENTKSNHEGQMSKRLRFNVIVENPPVICVTPEHNVSFTISLPRKVVLETSQREAFATEVVTHQVGVCEDRQSNSEWDYADDDTHKSILQNSNEKSCFSTDLNYLTDENGRDIFKDVNLEASQESVREMSKKALCGGRESNNLFTHLEETFKVLNGAYKIITGSRSESYLPTPNVPPTNHEELETYESFEEVLQNVSKECSQLETEMRRSSRTSPNTPIDESNSLAPPPPSSRSRPCSQASSRPNSQLQRKTPLGDVCEKEEDWEWEYYYEEEGEEELQILSPTTTAPTTRATSPFPPELPSLCRATISFLPGEEWEEVEYFRTNSRNYLLGENFAFESIHHEVGFDSLISVVLAAEFLGQTPVDIAAELSCNLLQKSNEDEQCAMKMGKIGVKELASRLEKMLFLDAERGTKLFLDQTFHPIPLKKVQKHQPRTEPAVIIHDATNPNQVTVHQSGVSTVVTMRRSGGNTLKVREPQKMKQGSPSEGSEAYGTGSTTSVVEQIYFEEVDDQGDGNRVQSRHSRLFRLLQDSDLTDSESEAQRDYAPAHRISLKSMDDYYCTKESDMDSTSSLERKMSFRSIRSSGKESDCDSNTSSGRGIGGDRSSLHRDVSLKRFMNANINSYKDFYASSSEVSTPTSPTTTDCPVMLSPERRRAFRHSSAFEDSCYSLPPSSLISSPLRLAPKSSGERIRGSPIRNSPKLELELLELVNLPSAPSLTLRSLPTKSPKNLN